jgi:hypothetical protein
MPIAGGLIMLANGILLKMMAKFDYSHDLFLCPCPSANKIEKPRNWHTVEHYRYLLLASANTGKQ